MRRFIEILEDRTEQETWSNSAIISCLVGFFIICVALMVPYFYLADLVISRFEGYKGVAFVGEIGRDGLTRAATIFVGFALCAVVALFMRSVRFEEGELRGFTGFSTFPFSDYYAIILWCSLAAFVPIVVVYVLNNYNWTGGGEFTLLNSLAPREIAQGLVFRYFLGLSFRSLCHRHLHPRRSVRSRCKDGQSREPLWRLPAHLSPDCHGAVDRSGPDANTTAHPAFFLSNFFAVCFFALPAILSFSRSYRSNRLGQVKVEPPAQAAKPIEFTRPSRSNGTEVKASDETIAAAPAGRRKIARLIPEAISWWGQTSSRRSGRTTGTSGSSADTLEPGRGKGPALDVPGVGAEAGEAAWRISLSASRWMYGRIPIRVRSRSARSTPAIAFCPGSAGRRVENHRFRS